MNHLEKSAQEMGTFATWEEVVAEARLHGWLLYHPPLNVYPARLRVVHATESRIRLRGGADSDPFNADATHLDRFRRRVNPGTKVLL